MSKKKKVKIENKFYTCDSFNQDISNWDVKPKNRK